MTTTPAARRRMHRLRWTGAASLASFRAACEPHLPWYHSYFDNDFEERGLYNIGVDIADYGFPTDMSGLRVLDIGTGAGWYAFYFEQLGAEVTAVDIRGFCDLDIFGRWEYPSVESEKSHPDRRGPDGGPIYHSPVSAPFWVVRELLGSSIEFVNARTYEGPPRVSSADAPSTWSSWCAPLSSIASPGGARAGSASGAGSWEPASRRSTSSAPWCSRPTCRGRTSPSPTP